jgi:hypothetical protein
VLAAWQMEKWECYPCLKESERSKHTYSARVLPVFRRRPTNLEYYEETEVIMPEWQN